ncbi:MAG TPA: pilin [Verrucomicrobiae bacterium]|nr:pilin [Verrucomicrobiae bacterium]
MEFLAITLPRLAQFAAPPSGCSSSFLGLESWFAYFPNGWFGMSANGVTYRCDLNNSFQLLPTNGQSGLLLIGLAVLDDLIRIATLVAVGYVIYGGFLYMTSQGSPDGTKRAQGTIINALVGLVIAILAASIVSFIGDKLGT